MFKARIGLMACALLTASAYAQTDTVNLWRSTFVPSLPLQKSELSGLTKYKTYSVNYSQLERTLHLVPRQDVGRITTGYIFTMPNPDGVLQRFVIAESPILSEQLSKVIPSKTYRFQGIDDVYASGRLDIGENGFHAYVSSAKAGDWFINPIKRGDKSEYVSYYRKDNLTPRNFSCYTETPISATFNAANDVRAMAFGTMKTYRLAMNATYEYTQYWGGVSQANSAIVTTINTINHIYQREFAITLNIVYSNPANNSNDGFSNDDGAAMLSQNQSKLDANPGNANYDIGHVFSTGGGGIAAFKSVGISGVKGMGVTGSPTPHGDAFDIDYVAHEMGHQFGGPHTFNSTAFNCGGGNRDANNAYEPGSGSTIMAYAGICDPENVQSYSDPYFHWSSLLNIWAHRNSAASGGTEVSTGNNPPTANAGSNYTIPRETPFILQGSGSDPDSSAFLTYTWEQADLGSSTNNPSQYSTGPLFRSTKPSISQKRFFPSLNLVRSNTSSPWEKLPNVDRTMKFRFTVQDNQAEGGHYAMSETTITVSGSPFYVTAPNGGETLEGSTTVTWNVGGGSVSPNVNIYLSTDGGETWPTLLLANTPNDGSQTVNLPAINSNTCRIIVAAASSVFYDMSNSNFTVQSTTALQSVSVEKSALVGGESNTGTIKLTATAPSHTTVSVSSSNPAATVPVNVVVPSGYNQTTFNITTTVVASTQVATISAVYAGVTKTTNFSIHPAPSLKTFSISPNPVRSGGKPTATITLNGVAPVGGAKVTLSETASEFSVPTYVIIPAGESSISFPVTTLVITKEVTKPINAKYANKILTTSLTLLPFDITNISFSPANLRGGQTSTCTVKFNAPAPPGLILRIADNDARTNVPAQIAVPDGATQLDFNITSVGTPEQFQVEIKYMIGTNFTRVRYLNVYPPLNYAISLNPTAVKGGTNSTATMTILGKAYSGFTMLMSSSGPEAIVPESARFTTTASTKDIIVKTTKVATSRSRIIRSTYGSVTKAATLTINP